jgi:hypothetical protein
MEKNIKRAFEKTGIWLLQPLIIIKQLQKQLSKPSTPSKLSPLPMTTLITAQAVRRLIKSSPSR